MSKKEEKKSRLPPEPKQVSRPTPKDIANRIRAMPDQDLLMIYNLAIGNLGETIMRLRQQVSTPLASESKVNKVS